MFGVLLSPLGYLRIRLDKKRQVDWLYPAVASVLTTVLIFEFGAKGAITGSGGVVEKILLVASVLPGFYIAALSAIATFKASGMDHVMTGKVPWMWVKLQGHPNRIELTRRRFLSFLFAFLCLDSIVLMLLCVFGGFVAKAVVAYVAAPLLNIVVRASCFAFLFVFWQMISVTLLGLYYLGDRLHRPAH